MHGSPIMNNKMWQKRIIIPLLLVSIGGLTGYLLLSAGDIPIKDTGSSPPGPLNATIPLAHQDAGGDQITPIERIDPAGVQKGDIVEIEYSYEKSGGNATVTMGDWSYPEKIEIALLGMRAGEEKEISMRAEEGYKHRYESSVPPRVSFYFTGKTALFRIKVRVITKKSHNIQEQKFGKVEFYSFEKGVEEAKKYNKPMFIYFRSDYCSWCRKFAEEVLTNASVVDRLKESFIPVAVDVDNEKDLLHQFDVFGTPTIVFADSNGKELKRLVGFINTGDFLGVLDEVAAGAVAGR